MLVLSLPKFTTAKHIWQIAIYSLTVLGTKSQTFAAIANMPLNKCLPSLASCFVLRHSEVRARGQGLTQLGSKRDKNYI